MQFWRKIWDRSIKSSFVLSLTLVIYLVPVICDLALYGWKRVFSYFAADTFYYLTVAQNYSQKKMFTFDQEYATNGFHPLYQVISAFLYSLLMWFRLPKPIILISFLFFSMACISLAIFFFAKTLQRRTGQIPVWFLFFPVGSYALLVSPIFQRYGTLWSFSNAMESPVVLLAFSLFLWIAARQGIYDTFIGNITIGFLLSVVFLARLDHILLIPAVMIGIAIHFHLQHKVIAGLRAIATIIVIPTLVLAAYLLVNHATVGLWTPVSGSIKTTFPHITAGRWKIQELTSLSTAIAAPDFGARAWRYTQILFPVIFAAAVFSRGIFLLIHRRFREQDVLFFSVALFVLFLGSYNFLFVPTFEQGHWYFPASIAFMKLFLVDWVGQKHWLINQSMAWASLLVVVVLCYFSFVYHDLSYNQRYAWFYQEAPHIQAYYASRNETPKLIEYDDGIIAYTTGYHTLSGFGFCIDKEAYQAMQQKTFLTLAYQRGYRYIASYYYFGMGRFQLETDPDAVKQYFTNMSLIGAKEADPFVFRVDYVSSDGRFAIIRMDLK